jgi:hypothetical protein
LIDSLPYFYTFFILFCKNKDNFPKEQETSSKDNIGDMKCCNG